MNALPQASTSTNGEAAATQTFGSSSPAADAHSAEQAMGPRMPDSTETSGTVLEHDHDGLTPLGDDAAETASPPAATEGASPSDREAAGKAAHAEVASAVLGRSSFQRNRLLSFVGASAVLRQGDDDLAVPFVSEAEAAQHGRSSMESYALASCSSDTLTTDVPLSDDEEAGGRPRSGWPLMLRSRYGTAGRHESGSDADPRRRSGESTAEGSPRTATAAGHGASLLPPDATQLQSEPTPLGPGAAADAHGPAAVPATEPPAALLPEVLPSAEQPLHPSPPPVAATEAATHSGFVPTRAEEQPGMTANASPAGTTPRPSLVTVPAPPAAEGLAAEELGGDAVPAADAEDEGPEWRMPGPTSNLPVAALVARYSRSLTSPAAVSPGPCN